MRDGGRRMVDGKRGAAASGEKATGRTRRAPADREREILLSAIAFFAEKGFDGQTRELAKSIGISQSLIYRYFPTKDDLIERVYDEVFGKDWRLDFSALKDRTQPLAGRLTAFYQTYAELILGQSYTRLLLYAALGRIDFHRRLFSRIGVEIYPHVIDELRAHFRQPPLAERPPAQAEIEALWGLHAAIFLVGIREHVFGLPTPDRDESVTMKVRLFLEGVAPTIRGRG